MKYGISSLKFWSRQCLTWLGIAAVTSLFMLLLQGMGDETPAVSSLDTFLFVMPFYLIVIGAFCALILGASTFQTMFGALVSMNVTRKAVTAGIILTQAAFIGCILAVSAGMWSAARMISGESDTMLSLLPLFAAVCFGLAAVGTVIGIIFLRWGKAGVIALVIICGVFGGIVGAGYAASDGELFAGMQKIMLEDLAGNNFWPLTAVSVIVFAAVAVFALIAARKVEVRV